MAAGVFQSSPGPKAGCYDVSVGAELLGEQVSILTRPEGRVLPGAANRVMACYKFQSSPGPKAGCYGRLWLAPTRTLKVSILTRPEGRVLLT